MVALRVQGQAYCNMEFNLGSQSEKSSLQLLICRAIQPAFTIRIDQRQRRVMRLREMKAVERTAWLATLVVLTRIEPEGR